MNTNETCAQAETATELMEPPKRYEIWIMTFPEGAAIHGCRPVIIVGNNQDFDQVTVIPLTSKLCYKQKSTHILVEGQGLLSASRGLGELITTLPCSSLGRRIGFLSDPFDRFALRHALSVHLGLSESDCGSCVC